MADGETYSCELQIWSNRNSKSKDYTGNWAETVQFFNFGEEVRNQELGYMGIPEGYGFGLPDDNEEQEEDGGWLRF